MTSHPSADRLLFGLGLPFFAFTLAIIGALVIGEMALVPIVIAGIVVMSFGVVRGFSSMLDDEDNDS